MLQRRAPMPADYSGYFGSNSTHLNSLNLKVTIKEKKAAKRKEKSRVAAQIRRNKESQTLILLQNALPINLPNPNQMLEKSIVIRIAGQTLFLLNNLDQALGMTGCISVPLKSLSFLAIFTDVDSQIVYISPCIQSFLDQFHWSNLIGMSLSDVIDCKSRWPKTGDIVRLKVSSYSNNNDCKLQRSQSSSSVSPLSPCPSNSRSAIISKITPRTNSLTPNYQPSSSSLFTVWCSTNICHTSSNLRLLMLRPILLNSIAAFNYSLSKDLTNNVNPIFKKAAAVDSDLSRSSQPLTKPKIDRNIQSFKEKSSCHQRIMSSVHDKCYNFEAVNSEFCHLIGDTQTSLKSQNFLDIIHLEDVTKIKSVLDQVFDQTDTHVWTPIYRLMCKNGNQCIVRTLAKLSLANSHQHVFLRHVLIRNLHISDYFSSKRNSVIEIKKLPHLSIESSNSSFNEVSNCIQPSVYVMRRNSTQSVFLKRKQSYSCGPTEKVIKKEVARSLSLPVTSSESDLENFNDDIEFTDENQKPNIKLDKDPLLTTSLDKKLIQDLQIINDYYCSSNNGTSQHIPDFVKLNIVDNFESESNCSASQSLESCVLTSPSPGSTDISGDKFDWDYPDDFRVLADTNTDLELFRI